MSTPCGIAIVRHLLTFGPSIETIETLPFSEPNFPVLANRPQFMNPKAAYPRIQGPQRQQTCDGKDNTERGSAS